ncbi:hypothetical protein Gasu2_12420 [Galdieria sulphuraria]|nr:hypothetical protein Gasu2_12420 [Galdieria sulphuraria]
MYNHTAILVRKFISSCIGKQNTPVFLIAVVSPAYLGKRNGISNRYNIGKLQWIPSLIDSFETSNTSLVTESCWKLYPNLKSNNRFLLDLGILAVHELWQKGILGVHETKLEIKKVSCWNITGRGKDILALLATFTRSLCLFMSESILVLEFLSKMHFFETG